MTIESVIEDIKYLARLVATRTKYRYSEFRRSGSHHLKRIQEYPSTIQMPITFHCNCNCVMCGMQNLKKNRDITPADIRTILKDRLFSKIVTVSINGGEPFLRADLTDCVRAITETLPSMKRLFIISNGTLTERLISTMREIREICGEKGIAVHLSISVDAIGELDDVHRGRTKAFADAEETLRRLHQDMKRYADSVGVICTLTKLNIYHVNEVDLWAKQNGYRISYNIASVNKRIDNFDRFQDFSLLTDEKARMVAKEFFYWKYTVTKEEKYFFLFLFLETGKRFGDCPCMYNKWITLNPDGGVSFCATQSDVLGNALDRSAKEIVDSNMTYFSKLLSENCETCAHYGGVLNAEGLHILHRMRLRDKFMRGDIKW